ncbi:hypothetical protein H0H87_007661 [Tephrocybe sp. NHM501043]|nr:hypothetical protein H0H87_007661 [Tephrocybe sp. NHM501043]
MLSRLSTFLYPDPDQIAQNRDAATASPRRTIPGVVTEHFHVITLESWLKLIEDVSALTERRLEDLQNCRVPRVEHYRGHDELDQEVVLVHIVAGEDVRVLGIERAQMSPEPTPSKLEGAVALVSVDASRAVWLSKRSGAQFQLVRSFEDLDQALNVIDVVALVHVIATAMEPYSSEHHMNMLFATVLFHLLHDMASGPNLHLLHTLDGPVFSSAGTVCNVKMVGLKGELLALAEPDIQRIERKNGGTKLAEAYQADLRVWESNNPFNVEPVSKGVKFKKAELERKLQEGIDALPLSDPIAKIRRSIERLEKVTGLRRIVCFWTFG